MTSKNPIDIADALMVKLSEKVIDSDDNWLMLDVFKATIDWCKVKNKINPDSDEGSKINEYRDTLKEHAGRSIGGGPTSYRRNQRAQKRKEAQEEGEDQSGSEHAHKSDAGGVFFNPSTAHGSFPVDDGSIRSGATDGTRSELVENHSKSGLRYGRGATNGVVDSKEGLI